jgi:ankyrin repeat protein
MKYIINDVDKSLFTAIADHDFEAVKNLLKSKDISLREAKDEQGNNFLQVAAANLFNDQRKFIHQPWQSKADFLNEKKQRANSVFIAEYVLKIFVESNLDLNSKNDDGETPLIIAAIAGNKSFVEKLLNNGVLIDKQTNEGDTALTDSIARNFTHIVVLLLARGANPEVRPNPLHPIIHGVGREMLEILLAGIASNTINNHQKDINHLDQLEMTPLLWVSKLGRGDQVNLLIEIGANVNLFGYSSWMTALNYAVKAENETMVKTLLLSGADPTIRDIFKKDSSDAQVLAKQTLNILLINMTQVSHQLMGEIRLLIKNYYNTGCRKCSCEDDIRLLMQGEDNFRLLTIQSFDVHSEILQLLRDVSLANNNKFKQLENLTASYSDKIKGPLGSLVSYYEEQLLNIGQIQNLNVDVMLIGEFKQRVSYMRNMVISLYKEQFVLDENIHKYEDIINNFLHEATQIIRAHHFEVNGCGIDLYKAFLGILDSKNLLTSTTDDIVNTEKLAMIDIKEESEFSGDEPDCYIGHSRSPSYASDKKRTPATKEQAVTSSVVSPRFGHKMRKLSVELEERFRLKTQQQVIDVPDDIDSSWPSINQPLVDRYLNDIAPDAPTHLRKKTSRARSGYRRQDKGKNPATFMSRKRRLHSRRMNQNVWDQYFVSVEADEVLPSWSNFLSSKLRDAVDLSNAILSSRTQNPGSFVERLRQEERKEPEKITPTRSKPHPSRSKEQASYARG